MRSLFKGLLFMHGHVVDVDLARRLADRNEPASVPARTAPPAAPRWLRRVAAWLGWLGCGAVRAWPN